MHNTLMGDQEAERGSTHTLVKKLVNRHGSRDNIPVLHVTVPPSQRTDLPEERISLDRTLPP